MEISEELNMHAKYETIEPEMLHLNIDNLYHNQHNNLFKNLYLSQLIRKRWENGIKSVILTKSKILEDIYLPSTIPSEFILIVNDSYIIDFNQLKESIDEIEDNPEKVIVIKCSRFDEHHFAHLKNFFDQVQANNENIKLNIFIVFYGIDLIKQPKVLELSTFKWPIFAMEDISIHTELDNKVLVRKTSRKASSSADMVDTKTIISPMTINEVEEVITKLNNIDEDTTERRCHYFIVNIFDNIIKYVEKDIRKRSRNDRLDIKQNYANSNFRMYSDFFKQAKMIFDTYGNKNYFDIQIDEKSFVSSKKSQIISHVYHELRDILTPFLVFRFGSQTIQRKSGGCDLDDFLIRCSYLDIPLRAFIKNSGSDPYDYLFLDFIKFLICNRAKFDETMKKQKFIADRLITAIGQTSEVQETFLYMFFSHFDGIFYKISGYIDEFKPIFSDEDRSLILMQTIVDFYRFRSIAGINIANHQEDTYWNKYMNYTIFLSEKKQNSPKKSKFCNRGTLIKSIVEFNNRSIFDIFVSPVIVDDKSIEASICRKLTSSNKFKINLEVSDTAYQIYKAFNEDPKSLKSIERLNLIEQKINDGALTESYKNIAISMLLFYAASKWDAVKPESILTILSIIKGFNNDDLSRIVHIERDYRVEKYDLSLPKFKSFGRIYQTKYRNIEWPYKGDCLIDEIQSMISGGSDVKPEFRKWLCCGFENDEPLSIVAFRRFLNSQSDETRADLAKVLDPFFGNKKVVDLFIDSIGRRIKDDSPFPFNDITTNDEYIMKQISFKSIFKFNAVGDKNILFRLNAEKPLLSQVIWFHVAFNKPSKYPLTTLLIKESPFFIDFQVVPRIINTLVHIRHIFSYNPVYIPIILHCTSLFKNCDCKLLLYSLNYFSTKYVKNEEDNSETTAVIKEFENIQNEVDSFEEFIKANYKDSYEIIRHQSSYHQIGFILSVYFRKYNSIIEKVKEYSMKYHDKNKEIQKLETIEASSILPNMLVTNLTLFNTILPLIYEKQFSKFSDIEEVMCKIFEDTDCFKDLSGVPYATNSIFPLFTVKIDKSKDYIGYTEEDYKAMFLDYIAIEKLQPVKLAMKNPSHSFHASVLSFFLRTYLNTNDDDLSPYIDVKNNLNDISDTHLNAYARHIHYELQINAKDLFYDHGSSKPNKVFKLYFEANSLYPIQSIFTYLPDTLKNKILEFQLNNKEGLKLIKSKAEVVKAKQRDETIALKSQIVEYQKQLENQKQSYEKKIKSLQKQIAQQEDNFEQLTNYKDELEITIGRLKQEVNEINLKHKAEIDRINIEAEKASAERALTDAKTRHTIHTLENKIEALTRENEELKNESEGQALEIKKLKDEISKNSKAKKSRNQQQLQNKEITILDGSDIKNIERIKEIGFGRGGRVYKVSSKKIYAMKEMNVQGGNMNDNFRKFLNEYEIMNSLNHPNIIQTFGIFLSNETTPPFILLEFCPTNLQEAVKERRLSNEKIVKIAYQIAEGMKYVHSHRIIHRDLKPTNILIADDDSMIKICDFGISKLMTTEEQVMTGGVGSYKYMAPEIINEEKQYDEKVDVYSFGVVLFFMLSGGEIPKIKIGDILNGKKEEVPPSFTDFAKDLIYECWNFKPNDRPSFNEIVEKLESNHYGLANLSNTEKKSIETFVKEHKKKIPPCHS